MSLHLFRSKVLNGEIRSLEHFLEECIVSCPFSLSLALGGKQPCSAMPAGIVVILSKVPAGHEQILRSWRTEQTL